MGEGCVRKWDKSKYSTSFMDGLYFFFSANARSFSSIFAILPFNTLLLSFYEIPVAKKSCSKAYQTIAVFGSRRWKPLKWGLNSFESSILNILVYQNVQNWHGCVKNTVIERRQHQLGKMADIPPPVTFSVFDL